MSATSPTSPSLNARRAPSSPLAVASQPSLSLVTRYRRKPDLWLPLSPFPLYSTWDVQGPQSSNDHSDFLCTPTLLWDSYPSTASSQLKSIFEDWDDLTPNSSLVIEEDGVQTLLIAPHSRFHNPPAAAKPFGYEPFSMAFSKRPTIMNEMPISAVPTTPLFDEHPTIQQELTDSAVEKPQKGQILFIDTTSYLSADTSVTLSASVFFSRHAADEMRSSWAPTGFMQGPDVPMDIAYSAVEMSATERWEEKPWLSVPLSTAPTSC